LYIFNNIVAAIGKEDSIYIPLFLFYSIASIKNIKRVMEMMVIETERVTITYHRIKLLSLDTELPLFIRVTVIHQSYRSLS